MDLHSVLQFLVELKKNNNREWFTAHKPKYEKAKQIFEQFVEHLIHGIHTFDPEPGLLTAKDAVFRIYRDVRFSKDKSPYKTNFGAIMAKGGKKGNMAGYYLHLAPKESMIAGGVYMPQGDILKAVRDEIYYHADAFKSVIYNERFSAYFGELEGDSLKRLPSKYPSDFPDAELLKYKSYVVFKHFNDAEVTSPDFSKNVLEGFKILKPFNQFINNAISLS